MDAELPSDVKVLSRADGVYEYVFVMNYATESRAVTLGAGEYADLLDGREYTGSVTLEKYGVKILKHKIS